VAGYSQLRVRFTFRPIAVGEFSYKIAVTNTKDQNNVQFIRLDASVLTQLDEVSAASLYYSTQRDTLLYLFFRNPYFWMSASCIMGTCIRGFLLSRYSQSLM